MDKIRKPFQGVGNIIRFNWHFYVLSAGLILSALLMTRYLDEAFRIYSYILCVLVIGAIFVSLGVSYYVYDLSELYTLTWLGKPGVPGSKIVNINAGFDETSHLLEQKFQHGELIVLDFYDPVKHTEISIRRARKACPAFRDTRQVTTTRLPLADQSTDYIIVIFAAHEIRNEAERITFFRELNRIIKPNGHIFITEHLRDLSNFIAYNIGFLHFYSRSSWHRVFLSAHLEILNELKCTPFISTFVLRSNGDTF